MHHILVWSCDQSITWPVKWLIKKGLTVNAWSFLLFFLGKVWKFARLRTSQRETFQGREPALFSCWVFVLRMLQSSYLVTCVWYPFKNVSLLNIFGHFAVVQWMHVFQELHLNVIKTALVTVTATVTQACASQACLDTLATTCACSLAATVDEFVTRVLHLRQCCPHWSPRLVITLPSPFRGAQKNWLHYKCLGPNVPTLIHWTLCVL